MTPEKLAEFDGKEGRPAYVAVGGSVYDVSSSSYWTEGEHEGQHYAGQDLTEELKSAPHVRAVIERFPEVDRIELSRTEKEKGIPLLSILIIAFVVILLIVTFMR